MVGIYFVIRQFFVFFSVLRQFKIVKPYRQPGVKFKNKTAFACCLENENMKRKN
jgi:hypothetical protein